MIALLKGQVEELDDGWAVIDVGGVGYLVFCSSRTLGSLRVGEAATVHVETHVREDHIHLYGFGDRHERAWFKVLTTVQGVGAKVALALLSVLSGDELTHAIAAGDKAQIGRATGVGPKLAQRIATELKDKVGALALGPKIGAKAGEMAGKGVPVAGGIDDCTRDAVSALVNLGYAPSDALRAVSHAAVEDDRKGDVQALIKGALAELGSRDRGR